MSVAAEIIMLLILINIESFTRKISNSFLKSSVIVVLT